MRRSRIKVTANLSAARRSTNKSNTDSENVTKEIERESNKIPEKDVNLDTQLKTVSNQQQFEPPALKSPTKSNENDCASISTESSVALNEKSHDADPATNQDDPGTASSENIADSTQSNERATFKTPLQMPRAESDPSGTSAQASTSSNKFRKSKIAPRLNASRKVAKAQDGDGENKKPEDVPEPVTPTQPQQDPEPSLDFTVPIPSKTPREVIESPGFTVNHNVQHTAAPPSPFPFFPHSHGRIRTESLCSIKSSRDFTVANLQPRKNIRTEDQKIIDIKRESRERLSNKDLDKSKLRMFDMIYFNPQNNPMKPRSPQKQERPKKVEILMEAPPTPEVKTPSAMPVPQLRLNANGEMVLDETTLVIENEQQKQNRILLANNTVVYHDDLSGNYGYYKRQQRTKEWPHDETVKFYRCLNTVGTDFSLMLNLFPNRSRRDLKLKFKKEERSNPQLIDKALLKHNTFDLDELQRELDLEEEQRKREAEAKSNSELKELVKQKILKKQEAKLKASKVERILSGGTAAIEAADKESSQLEVKENLANPSDSSEVKKKRSYKRKPKVDIVENVLIAPASSMNVADLLEPPPKKVKKSRKKAIETVKQYESSKEEVAEISNIQIADMSFVYSTSSLADVMEANEVSQASTLSTAYFYDDKGNRIDCQVEEFGSNQMVVAVDAISDKKVEVVENTLVKVDVPIPEVETEKQPASKKSKKKIKMRPALVKRMKLDTNGDMVPDDAAVMETQEMEAPKEETEAPPEIVTVPENVHNNIDIFYPVDETYPEFVHAEFVTENFQTEDPEQVYEALPPAANEDFLDSEFNKSLIELSSDHITLVQVPVDENLNETKRIDIAATSSNFIPEPSTSTAPASAFDEEAFLNSLDMEKLFIVEAQHDGRDVYEIYGTDPVTQEMADKPMDLPQRYIDLIIKIMTQEDDDE